MPLDGTEQKKGFIFFILIPAIVPSNNDLWVT